MIAVPARRLLRAAAWLLMPVVVWAASLFGGWLGATVSRALDPNEPGLVPLGLGGVLGGGVGLLAWMVVLRLLAKGERRGPAAREAGNGAAGPSA